MTDAVYHDRRRRARDVTDLQGDPLVGIEGMAQVLQQVDRSGLGETVYGHLAPEALNGLTGMRIESVEEEPGRHHVDDVPAIDVGVGDALTVVLPHRVLPPKGAWLAEGPQRLPRAGVHGDHVATLSGHRNQHPIHIDRRRARQHVSEARSVPLPGDLEGVEVCGGDLVERGVLLAPHVAADELPLRLTAGAGPFLRR